MLDFLVALGAIAAIVSALPAVGIDVRIFGRGTSMSVRPVVPQWRWWLAIVIASLALAGSGYRLYQTTLGVRPALSFDPTIPLERVMGKSFQDETVYVDGKEFIKCTFENVTFHYDGKARYMFREAVFTGHEIVETNNSSIYAYTILLSVLKGLKAGVTMKDGDGVSPIIIEDLPPNETKSKVGP